MAETVALNKCLRFKDSKNVLLLNIRGMLIGVSLKHFEKVQSCKANVLVCTAFSHFHFVFSYFFYPSGKKNNLNFTSLKATENKVEQLAHSRNFREF